MLLNFTLNSYINKTPWETIIIIFYRTPDTTSFFTNLFINTYKSTWNSLIPRNIMNIFFNFNFIFIIFFRCTNNILNWFIFNIFIIFFWFIFFIFIDFFRCTNNILNWFILNIFIIFF